MAGRQNPRRSGALEKEIVACLAAARWPLTPAQVQTQLGGDLAYTTVLTTLTRLHTKQAVVREPRGRAYAYSLAVSQADSEAGLIAHQMQKLLAEDVDTASVLSRFVDTLDDDSEKILRDLLGRTQDPR
ncbi:BlaI/MecI/CopY family transcriptional regulator [Kineosporia mesophila]|uniref:BlaI/MecI/CopY family transcriptional regulator n=1 Tax=Kineosporia mesophila TaxID=566012 RepID=A0ABP6ZNB2_9ACTN|nr:BlaI/MecI/CopY family transcriptional regulator [Kineosporia mesophila]MCD5355104.1 BlaI/MecI/CopY family transcriptional regulator [Kineosporia mesophila]